MLYRTIVADPPWATRTGPMSAGGMGLGFNGGADTSQPLAYPTMTVGEITSLPVGDLADDNAHLYLWTTQRFLPDAFEVVRAWGFKYSTTQTWGKALMGGGLGGTFRINSEFFLFAYRGRCDAKDSVRGTWFDWSDPADPGGLVFDWKRSYGPPVKRGERRQTMHSVKPSEFFDLVEQVSPGPYLELFARRPRIGWDQAGDQSAGTVHVPGLRAPEDVAA